MSTKLRTIAIALCLAALGLAGLVVAQGQPRARQRANTPRSRTTQTNPEVTRERMMQRMQQQLGGSDAEWQIIQPRLVKVVELSRRANRRGPGVLPGRAGGRRNPDRRSPGARAAGRRARSDADRTPSAVEKTATELRDLLNDANATSEQIEAKLTALRRTRQDAQEELAQARSALQEVLIVKQEARLVLLGLLE